jgi:Plasmid pRiA4b ORF-3-like protein
MGWTDTHLHHFEIINPSTLKREEIGIPDEDFDDLEIHPGWKRKIADYFKNKSDKAKYIYDYGDDWEHAATLEKILPREEGIEYPLYSGGAGACPPEDCGGKRGYADFLEAIMDPAHESHEEMLDWVGGEFDPEHFDVKDVQFDDPKKRLENALAID